MFEARFQSFDDPQPAQTGPRVQALRAELARRGLSGFILPRADRHQNEYVPPSEERLAWLTGFTGSAGIAVVLADKAALFVDGRYTLQAADQVDTRCSPIVPIAETTPERWLEQNLPSGAKLGYDPWLHTAEGAERLARACANAGATLVAGRAQSGRCDLARPAGAAARAGGAARSALRRRRRRARKLDKIRAEIASLRADALVMSDPHAVAWTFNIRGSDVAHTPLPLAFAIVPKEGRPTLYIDGAKLSNAVRHKLEEIDRGARARRFHRRSRRRSARRIAPCGSTRRPAPTRCRASSARPAAR